MHNNKDSLNLILTNSKEDIKGAKALLPYLSTNYKPKEIIFSSTLVNIQNETNSYNEEEFLGWLRFFCEKISTFNLLQGNLSNFSDLNKDIYCRFNSFPREQVIKALKTIGLPKTYAAALKILKADSIQSVLGKYDSELWKQIENYSLDKNEIEEELNRIIIAITKEHSIKNETFTWTTNNLYLLPNIYLDSILSKKSFHDLVLIIIELDTKNKHHLINNIEANMANTIIKQIEKLDTEERERNIVNQFIEDIQTDFNEGKFKQLQIVAA